MHAVTAALVNDLAKTFRGQKPFAKVPDMRGHLETFLFGAFVDNKVREDPTEAELNELEAALREKLGEELIEGSSGL